MATEMVFQRSATSPREAPTRRDCSPAKRDNGPRTGHPNPKPSRIAGSPSKACGSTKETTMRDETFPMSATTCGNDLPESTALVVRELRPRQILAARMLIEGRLGKDVAAAIGVSPETVSRWKAQPEFQDFTRLVLQDTIDATRLGIVSLCAESIEHLRGLVRSFNDQTALKEITLILGKVGPVLGVVGEEIRATRVARPEIGS